MIDDILEEIRSEKEYQKLRWGNELDDNHNSPFHWATYISQYATKWMYGNGLPTFNKDGTDAFRTCMVKVATLAISAIESIDRQREQAGKPFYEEK